jgi:predicted metal-binding membrane protein
LAVVIGLIALSVLAWQSTVEQAISMSGMVMGLGQIGGRAQGDMSAAVFLVMWMAGIFALFFVEKSWRHGLVLAKIAGLLLMVLGATVVARPALLASISL